MTSADAIVRASLHNEVVSRIRQAIVEGVYAPGERLNERILCERYSISRTPLREAFKVLALEGLVTISQNRGAIVTPLTLNDFVSVIEVMSHLELLVGRTAADRMSQQAIEDIRSLHHEMCICHLRRDLSGYFTLNQKIHAGIVEGTGNPIIVSTYATLNRKVTRFRYMANLSDERWKTAIDEHETFMRALIQRNGEKLGTLLHDHLRNKAVAIKNQLI